MADQSASPLRPPIPRSPGERRDWYGLPEPAQALALASAAEAHTGLVLAVAASSQQALHLEAELGFFLDGRLPVEVMPDWETLPYDVFSPHQDIISQRLRTLHDLPGLTRGVLIVPAGTLMQRIAPRSFLEGTVLRVAVGDHLALEPMRERLERAGYRCVSEVMEHGEFAVRGSLLDLYPMGSETPYRIDLFDDEVDSIRLFDPETQRSAQKVDRIELLPAREFPTGEEGITRFRRQYRAAFEGDPTASTVYRDVSDGRMPNGIEYYLPLFFEQTGTLFDYLPEGALAVRTGPVDEQLGADWEQIAERYEQRRHDRERPLLPPERLYLSPDEVRSALNRLPQVRIPAEDAEPTGQAREVTFTTSTLPDLRSEPGAARPLGRLEAFAAEAPERLLFLAETAGRRETLRERLQQAGLRPEDVSGWAAFAAGDPALGLTVGPLEAGFRLPDDGIAVVPDTALFAERAKQRRRRQSTAERDPDAIIRDLTDLHPGAPVVHENHGVGRYRGLQTLDVGNVRTEFLTLEYAGGDKLYVPVASLHLITRYTGTDSDAAPLHRLGGEQWEKARRKAAERARDVAAELLDIYARREAQSGHAHRFPREEYERFAAQFPFEETPDQETAIHAVIRDLEQERPMDRVVCGDVGFGKTEVAMRAAFVGVQAGGQVAVLVPTTLLAQQHYQNFSDRFADWPVRIELLSRFRSQKEQNAVLRDLAAGKVDIVIGTHKLLQGSVKFDNLGLLIIDEEHRFGVRQKEALKRLRANVDVLTLTATPIPRTLNMSLAGMRDLSIIATPPARRLAVKTFVNQWNDALIREACLRELHRGGQVYFLHNDVETIERVARELEALVPEARVRIAHGQMRERELERVMLDFYHQRFNVLVCTTIVESGIDVPSANTIVINRADRLGLAQLHQLRGRVGRSHHRAYAYLVAPPKRQLTPDAAKRLEAIASLEDLGIGFALASHDLEIRGAGELLGEGQSGQIQEVGFSMYSELLERAVRDLRAGREPALDRPLHHGTEVDLRIPALLPEEYLPDVHTRLVLYKRIASAPDENALRELQVEMIDRFGLLPEPARNLFRLAELRLRAERLGLERIEAGPGGGVLTFSDTPRVDPAALVQLVQEKPAVYRLEGQERLRFRLETEAADERIGVVSQLMDALEQKEAA
ncbi:transcription-repair coupling factor [Sediminicurvatus halobius]|uniref:Transcription-repair-coupling factor n=1 Tax=Sediminicurvatus halobius TaxID=2182432 RepID=A0A2U2N202_9GAMM|nr:transcription-repair coupling factor [Spiribacter halobius]PWG63216.1 transcription-repair coupling factor [Spiribacter halobius]UEX76714.1 transcription-repair coupling factor [Spiribacter halobius]